MSHSHKSKIPAVLGIAFVLTVAALIWFMLHFRHRGNTSAPRIESRKEYVPPAELANFDPVSGGVLVLTANRAEFDAVLLTLRERNQLRKSDARMTFDVVDQGIRKVTWNVKKDDKLVPVVIYIANAGEIAAPSLAYKIGGKKFRLLTLRGHGADMLPLWQYSLAMQDNHCFTILGGCTASGLIRQLYTPVTPVLADIATGESANNTYLLVRFIDLVGGGKVTTWGDLASTLTTDSGRVLAQTTMPGKEGYSTYAQKYGSYPQPLR